MRLLLCIVICELAGIAGAVFTGSSVTTWLAALRKPPFNPPAWLFAPVWTALYALMGIAAFLIWKKGLGSSGVKGALVAFVVQLALNALWSPAFFGLRSPAAGLCVIVPLWAAILWTIMRFYPISHAASALLVPYFVWVSFAAILNAAIAYLN
jgi:translocator protein